MSGADPVITFVIPAYNAAGTIGRTLDSLGSQTDPRWDAVVVDDGSTDGTADVVRSSDIDSVRLVRQMNTGLSGARNKGFAEASAPLVCFLDSDDTIDAEFVEVMAPLAQRSERGAICGFRFVNGDGREIGRTPAPTAGALRMPGLLAMDPPAVMSIVHRRESLLRAAGSGELFDTSLGPFEDWDLLRRIASSGCGSWETTPDTLVSYWCMPGSLTTNTRAALSLGLKLIERHAPDDAARSEYARRHCVCSLAASVISADTDSAAALIAELGPLDSDDRSLLCVTLGWHARRRWAIAEDELVSHAAEAEQNARAAIGDRDVLATCLGAIARWRRDPWAGLLRRADALRGHGGRLVLFGAGRNGAAAAATADRLGIACVIADDDGSRRISGFDCIEVRSIRPADAVLVTPARSSAIVRRLRHAGLARIIAADAIDQAA